MTASESQFEGLPIWLRTEHLLSQSYKGKFFNISKFDLEKELNKTTDPELR
jgi:hypothetical protein